MKKINFLKLIIDKKNYQAATPYCRAMAERLGKGIDFAMQLFDNIRNGLAKIYIYEDNSYDYKRIK